MRFLRVSRVENAVGSMNNWHTDLVHKRDDVWYLFAAPNASRNDNACLAQYTPAHPSSKATLPVLVERKHGGRQHVHALQLIVSLRLDGPSSHFNTLLFTCTAAHRSGARRDRSPRAS